MGTLEGKITVSELPPHRGLIVSLCLYRVESASAVAPYNGAPPAEVCHRLPYRY